jgi:hypothetical protein
MRLRQQGSITGKFINARGLIDGRAGQGQVMVTEVINKKENDIHASKEDTGENEQRG